jgi:peptidoglycan/xylan/chitin deacetylase (PgdA/CDA1 family)
MATGRLSGFPVLMYHGIARDAAEPAPPGERKYWVTAAQLREHLLCIQDAGCRVAALSEIWRSPATTGRRQQSVALSFDDGRASDYDVAFPVLLEAHATADFFVNTANIGTPGFLGWGQIRDMQRADMSFQSHGHEHVDLSRLTKRELLSQLRESKRRLEDGLGTAVEFLAAPYGLFDRRVLDAAREQGFSALCTSNAWPARPGAQVIGRIAIYRHTRPGEIRRIVTRHPVPYLLRAARAGLIYLPKRALRRFRPSQPGARILEGQA